MKHNKLIKVGFACLILCFIGVCLTGTTIGAGNDINLIPPIEGAINYDYQGLVTDHIGNITAPDGMYFVTVALYIDNQSDKIVPLEPSHYILICDGVAYPYDSATYDKSIASTNGYVLPGGSEETQIVYKVKSASPTFSLYFLNFPKATLHSMRWYMPNYLKNISDNVFPIMSF